MQPETTIEEEFNIRYGDAQKKAFVCIVEIQNSTPPAWQAVIGGGCKFVYQNDNGQEIGSYIDVHERLDVGTGKSLFFQSDQPNSCVKRVEVVVTLATPLLPNQQTFPATDSADAQHCLKNPVWSISPQKSQAREDMKNGDVLGIHLKQLD